jgi:hypothetical protein
MRSGSGVPPGTVRELLSAARRARSAFYHAGRLCSRSTAESRSGKDDPDADVACPFRNSTIYRSVYVYPSPGDKDWKGSILSKEGRLLNSSSWPWVKVDRETRRAESNRYHVSSQHAQSASELLVRQPTHETSLHAQAIADAINGDHQGWNTINSCSFIKQRTRRTTQLKT